MSKEEKAQSKRKCYSYRESRHMTHSCPLGNTPKPTSIGNDSMLRKGAWPELPSEAGLRLGPWVEQAS